MTGAPMKTLFACLALLCALPGCSKPDDTDATRVKLVGKGAPGRNIKAEASVGEEVVFLDPVSDAPFGFHFQVKFKSGQAPEGEIALVFTSDDGKFLESSPLEMNGTAEISVSMENLALPVRRAIAWVGRPVEGWPYKFTRISNIVIIEGG